MRLSPEESIQATCVDFTAVFCPEILLSASMNGLYLGTGKNVGAYIEKQKTLGMLPGEMDIMLTWPLKNILFIEMKAGKNILNDNQIKVANRRTAQGFDCCVCYTFQEYFAALTAHRVPMRHGIFPGIGKF